MKSKLTECWYQYLGNINPSEVMCNIASNNSLEVEIRLINLMFEDF